MDEHPDGALYVLHTPVGTFWIAPQRDRPGFLELGIGTAALGWYHSAEAAAEDVATRTTGCRQWDASRRRATDPRDLMDWVRLPTG